MNLLNINVPKDRASMILDPYTGAETYSTTLYLYKSNIVFDEEGNKYSARMEIDLNKNPKKVKMIKQTLARHFSDEKEVIFPPCIKTINTGAVEKKYNGDYINMVLEDDFSELLGVEDISSYADAKNNFKSELDKCKKENTSRYVSTKKFLDYYNKAFELVKKDYIKFQKDICNTVDFIFNLHESNSRSDLDRVSKFLAYSTATDLLGQFYSNMRFSIMKGYDKEDIKEIDNNEKIEALAYEIANDKMNNMNAYLYESTSHFALAYISLNDLIRNSKKNISICQNCGRYFLPNSGKEIYCELFNLDGSPSCRTYASRKTYEGKIIDNIAELTYKREYQRRITRVYRSDKNEKTMRQKEFALWKTKAREQLSKYRQNKITQKQFCDWIEKNK